MFNSDVTKVNAVRPHLTHFQFALMPTVQSDPVPLGLDFQDARRVACQHGGQHVQLYLVSGASGCSHDELDRLQSSETLRH